MSTTASQPPIPPRPSRSTEKQPAPMIPPRPLKNRIDRSMSPNPNRFAPSPLNEGPIQPKSAHPLRNGHNGEDIKRSTSVDLPSLGQEGMEYANITENPPSSEQSTTPEQTRTIGHDLKLHAPKPSLPPAHAKQRIMAVTRTDSDRAAAFGIGRPSSHDESTHVLPANRSLKKKASTTSQLSVDLEDEHGIPQIGQQVPMYKNAGDVQAPSPAPGATAEKAKNHTRRTSSRGGLPPGSYGLHGHGVFAVDKLEKAYFDKHPEALKKEHTPYQYDRSNDFAMSSENLNKIVRETASRGAGLGVQNYPGTPSEQIGWQAIEESTSRVASPRPSSSRRKSPVKPTFAVQDDGGEPRALEEDEEPKNVIHVDEPSRRHSRGKSMDGSAPVAEEEEEYTAPILAEDEVAKNPSLYDHEPAVVPERREHAEHKSRPNSRPTSIYRENSYEMRSTPLEDVEEYEPLFRDDEQPAKKPEVPLRPKTEHKRRFPSADVWEDAPSSTMYTAEVSTPEPSAEQQEEEGQEQAKPQVEPREGETFAQAFARQQEELAEKEARENGPDGFVKSSIPKSSSHQQKPSWVQGQPHLLQEVKKEAAKARPAMAQRFPSRDVWEDSPESLQLQTEVSTPQQDEEQTEEATAESPQVSPRTELPEPKIDEKLAQKPEIEDKTPEPKEPAPTSAVVTERKPSPPVIPARPSLPSRPSIPDRPKPKPAAKPAIPARLVKASPTSGGLEPAEAAAPPRQKPAVPARPMGSKIAALQAGFMNDLNNRLRLGPQMPAKKEEAPAEEQEKEEKKEKVPLSDARKGRARGPQRRAPAAAKAAAAAAAAPAPAVVEEKKEVAGPKLSFSVSISYWAIDPESEEGGVSVGVAELKALEEEKPKEKTEEVKAESKTETEAEKPTLENVKDEAKVVVEKLAPEPFQNEDQEEAPKEEIKEEKTPEPESEPSPLPEAITPEAPGAFPSTPAIERELKAQEETEAETEAESSAPADTPTSTEAPAPEPVEAREAETAASEATEQVEDKRDATTASAKAEAAAADTEVTNSSNTGSVPDEEAPKEEVKSLVTNTAGETIVAEHVTRDGSGNVKPLEVEDKGGEEA
ncbi:hypothetical protein NEUTE1DRAFT_87103 [Neurospora tetrasperma FGSC 2508]|uniref:Altered inheritance of mitochondria protein 21 n=1 Tax=Neurospora tetrasperma (strain FGSC 2508 / ATCC MYA-4615 / P0657) TaxID=510951 RepID=F8MWD1_NEUT8|nr:uncharacterized protein NEUTE1DRAFT_87103 [Neurospora tetrasperma FGSC 2508]EGO54073.1 hypothetical protein NEUTE1DRAFT_87103 [Neurospora tetrasperma FGSC 2508]EGZ68504.1 hypothetical protein NEUTE2DRAFT_118458 [Neurospora tetrasperma FGSC 2509]